MYPRVVAIFAASLLLPTAAVAGQRTIPTFSAPMPNFNSTFQRSFQTMQNSSLSMRQQMLEIQEQSHAIQEQLQRTTGAALSTPAPSYAAPIYAPTYAPTYPAPQTDAWSAWVPGPPACRAEAVAYCRNVTPGGGRIIACLRGRDGSLSAPCAQAMSRFAVSYPGPNPGGRGRQQR